MEEDLDVEEIANSLGRQVDELNNKVEELENDDRNNSYMEEDDVEKMIESALDDELGKLAIDDTELLEYTSDLGDRVDDVEETLKTLENIDLDEVVENVDRLKRFLRSLKATLNELEV
jgi:HAMP domain-containing protein